MSKYMSQRELVEAKIETLFKGLLLFTREIDCDTANKICDSLDKQLGELVDEYEYEKNER